MILSLGQYVEAVSELNHDLWFRGVGSTDFQLTPEKIGQALFKS
ncbi:hypothetical protein N483_14655 [Pseudoalteromonas luteoviolacea NCIMB 1944]|uniref:Uncharacterized protein n=1 Tax=Pseudoalteromonas luteoviolacea (strain 2ta16) TaxID=1353533 RepID=V4HL88_PSEL2|nr:hypothetical protein PL2TA16_01627 [Pseudoalteromonas luteoviolacea 2ta16]KZN41909.1 hypothetical protein N483_14655 [Pseudoalteromonas luteoviolacea NCIMB 1944]